MIESMTGFGRASAGKGSLRWRVEIRSLNHRFFDLNSKLPELLAVREADIEKMLRPVLRRGRVNITISRDGEWGEAERPVLDEKKLDFFVRAMKKMARRYRLKDELRPRDLFLLPGVFTVEKKNVSERFWPVIKSAIQKASEKLRRMRLAEGRMIARDFAKRLRHIAQAFGTVEMFAKTFTGDYRGRLEKKVKELSQGLEIEPERLAKEVVLRAERADITEEIVRGKHHVDSLLQLLDSHEEAGKKIDFILQEIQREANTIASKSEDVRISNEVIRIKSELEKIREQVQNIV